MKKPMLAHELHNAHISHVIPKMPSENEMKLSSMPHETNCYTDYDQVWDSNYPRGLEVIQHGPWAYGPRGE